MFLRLELELVVVSAEQLRQLGINEQLLFAERHFTQHTRATNMMQKCHFVDTSAAHVAANNTST
jgi:hypothetical protein